MKRKFKVLIEMAGLVALGAVGAGVGYGASALITKLIEDSKTKKAKGEYGDVYDYYLKNGYGIPLKLPIKDNVVAIVLDSFGEEAKENARHAISKLDAALPKQEFTIYDNGSKPNDKNYIRVSLVQELTSSSDSAVRDTIGTTHFDFDFKGQIKYPVEIEIENKYVSEYNNLLNKRETEKSAFSTILQHELGHAFGLCDRYNKSDYGDTIMYYSRTFATQNYTDRDIYNLRYVYDDEYRVSVSQPSVAEVRYYIPQKQTDMENIL